MFNLVLYCCTFRKDLKRTVKLAESVRKHNKAHIPFYISVPAEDVDLFKTHLAGFNVLIFDEKDIFKANPKLDAQKLYSIRGGLRQQVIKSEFWRLGISENYLVLDSDCIFIRDFDEIDFIALGNTPYSVIHEGRDVLQAAERFGPKKIRQHFLADREPIKQALGRTGVTYDFGYAPFLWSRKVWESLDINYLTPNGMNFLDAVLLCGSEFTWYGESLIHYRAIPIFPREQLFKHYHYEHQLWADQILGYKEKVLAYDYLGVVYQSNWESWGDFGPSNKSVPSRLWRSIKRLIKKAWFKIKLLSGLIVQ
ncbi:hypothetical protein AOC06_01285 [Polynucleobacter paludilacus]|uniref:DUF6492 family protein n=1 Tax=Polynucleobacter paludilacus TaxID=1855895 RepID=UPI001BFD2616|nr:DUF6492 family protein [Polynucleobacter paludilacus]QWD87243.1 hypothetical protein AOC06_01285 [Polynucleobacter paludilacus]